MKVLLICRYVSNYMITVACYKNEKVDHKMFGSSRTVLYKLEIVLSLRIKTMSVPSIDILLLLAIT